MIAKRMGRVALILAMSVAVQGFAAEDGLEKGTPQIQSAGPMTFGPNGILFVGDPKAATVAGSAIRRRDRPAGGC